jgi:hypothetical protein
VNAAGMTLQTTPVDGGRLYAWEEIIREAHAQRQARRPATETAIWLDAYAFTRWSVVLRVTGRLLDGGGQWRDAEQR